MVATIRKDGKEYVIVRSSIQCLHCKDVLISLHRRDFTMCSCGAVGLDGALDAGATVVGSPGNFIDLSIWRTRTEPYEYLNGTP
jgi:hypothetical protein